ncbi:iron-sulfur cluster biosynthesis family protein [Alkalicoccus chagannorensis]|uniref:iron-sulfur cluster biosynthesis family protein n=1 Tax=Alkalicoccus chagannorensis TaxID=427072 RepID=UPI0003F8FD1A|nr:iron-sulfur cluster biosynthesis family protein [Alkalicoccus chagannorensis]
MERIEIEEAAAIKLERTRSGSEVIYFFYDTRKTGCSTDGVIRLFLVEEKDVPSTSLHVSSERIFGVYADRRLAWRTESFMKLKLESDGETYRLYSDSEVYEIHLRLKRPEFEV